MTYKGHVQNGSVVLDESADLPDGAFVTVEIAAAESAEPATPSASLAEHYRCLVGAIDGLPEDWSEDHDKYLREQYVS